MRLTHDPSDKRYLLLQSSRGEWEMSLSPVPATWYVRLKKREENNNLYIVLAL